MSYEKISKYMSMILRHRPETIGITLDEHGWADVDELIEGIAAKKKFNREILEEIVRTDKKQRYSFNEDKTRIRANQGHSIPVDLDLEPSEPPEILWHGTAEKYVASIDRTGLRPGNRMYVHLSADEQTAFHPKVHSAANIRGIDIALLCNILDTERHILKTNKA